MTSKLNVLEALTQITCISVERVVSEDDDSIVTIVMEFESADNPNLLGFRIAVVPEFLAEYEIPMWDGRPIQNHLES